MCVCVHGNGGGVIASLKFSLKLYYKSSKKDCNGLARNEMWTFFLPSKIIDIHIEKQKQKLKSQIVEFNWSNVCANQNAFLSLPKIFNYFIFHFNGHKKLCIHNYEIRLFFFLRIPFWQKFHFFKDFWRQTKYTRKQIIRFINIFTWQCWNCYCQFYKWKKVSEIRFSTQKWK